MKFLLFLLAVVIPPSFCRLVNVHSGSPSTEDNHLIEPNVILPLDADQRDCGGVIPLSPLFPSHIYYKEGQLYDPLEFCVWILAPQDGVNDVHVTVQLNISDAIDGISVYFLNETGLTGQKLPRTNTDFNFNTPLAFLVFYSNGGVQSNGFSIDIKSTGVSSPRQTTAAFHVRKGEGKFSYPMIEDPMRNKRRAVALVIQKNSPGYIETVLEVSLKNVDIDEDDSILIYSLNVLSWSADLALVGRFTTDAQVEIIGHNPLLFLLESKNTLRGKGFQVEWKVFQNSIE